MLHWIPTRTTKSSPAPIGALLSPAATGLRTVGASRSDHARMLAHAASRRRSAAGMDRSYWLACAPAAVARAAAIRTGAGFAPLP